MAAVRPTFADTINNLAFNPSSEQGTGLLPPFVRAMGHVILLVSNFREETQPSAEQVKEQITDIKGHLASIVLDDRFTEGLKTYFTNLSVALDAAEREIARWTPEESSLNMRNLSNRMTQFTSNLDREVIGIRTTDPGYNL